MSRIFHRAISSSSYLEFDTDTKRIVFKTQMYNKTNLMYEMLTVDIDELEWNKIIEYGEEAGFYRG